MLLPQASVAPLLPRGRQVPVIIAALPTADPFHEAEANSPFLIGCGMMSGMEPILCAPLLRAVDLKLLELLASLQPEEWNLPTVAGEWLVRDVAAHLLDAPLRKLSMVRDGCYGARPAEDLVTLVNRLNREGVVVYRRLSPAIMVKLMKAACEENAAFHESLDPFSQAAFAVSWAGETFSLNWFDTARELTERWHHQQQIRLATGRPGIMTPELYTPVLECFVRGLPFAYRDAEAPAGTAVQLDIAGDCGGSWQVRKALDGWVLVRPSPGEPAARVVMPQEIAWRVFTRGITTGAATAQIRMEGRWELGMPILGLTAVVA